jgi:hypothetical protein
MTLVLPKILVITAHEKLISRYAQFLDAILLCNFTINVIS